MPATAVHTLLGRGEVRIAESSHRDRDQAEFPFWAPHEAGSAFRTEGETHFMTVVGTARVVGGSPGDHHPVFLEERRDAKGTTGAPLAREAVA